MAEARSRWDLIVENAMRNARTQSGWASLPLLGMDAMKGVANFMNAPIQQPAAANAPAPAPALAFSPSVFQAPTITPQPQANPYEALLTQNFPGLKITSGARTPEKNAEVGGVPNSMHIGDFARDFVLPNMSTASRKSAVAGLKKTGMFTEVLDEGDHIHVGWRPPTNTANPTITPQQALTSGVPVQYVNPAFAMSMMPQPRMLPGIDLPNPPQRELPGDIPLQDEISKSVLDQIASVIKPAERDKKFDKWDRVAALLQGAAAGAAGADPAGGLGQFLLRAGAGGLAGFRGEAKEQRELTEQEAEKIRQANLALAKMGLDIDLQNFGIKNTNKDRTYKSGEDKKDVKFQNANSLFETMVREALTNMGIQQQNIGALNAADQTRARVGLSATEGAVAAQNAANASTASAGLRGAGQAQEAAIQQGLVKYGVDATNEKAPTYSTSRGTMSAVLAGDIDGALQNFAQELVLTGAAEKILAPDKGDAPEAAKAKQEALRALRSKDKNQIAAASQTIASLMASDHAAALAIAKAFSAVSPSARIIMGENKAKVK